MASPIIAPLVAIVGETGSGKSALAMMLAKKFNGEIICADSWTVYRDFNIGTNKPTLNDQQEVRHHLLDVAYPTGGFSASEFKKLALKALTEITARNKLPIIVGGTGLYIDSVLYDYSFLPPGSTEKREQLSRFTLNKLLLLAESSGFDLTRIDMRNKRRVIRLIESGGRLPERKPLRPNTLLIGMAISRESLELKIKKGSI